jgi:hypothetical protein
MEALEISISAAAVWMERLTILPILGIQYYALRSDK